MLNMNNTEEEFNNFMLKVNEVSGIVKKLTSSNEELNRLGSLQADQYLNNKVEKRIESMGDKDVVLTVKSNKTILNKLACEDYDQERMSQEQFMRVMSRDVEQRKADKKVRREKSDTLKKQGNLAFRRGEYEKALSLYNKSIEYIKDSVVLYTNRALTYLYLKMYDEAIKDCETAMKLNEDSLKAWLYMAKGHYENGNIMAYEHCVKEAKLRNPGNEDIIENFSLSNNVKTIGGPKGIPSDKN